MSTARSVEDETRNSELNRNRNPEWWGDFSQLVNRENQISRYLTVQSRIEILIGFEFRGIFLVQMQIEIFV